MIALCYEGNKKKKKSTSCREVQTVVKLSICFDLNISTKSPLYYNAERPLNLDFFTIEPP